MSTEKLLSRDDFRNGVKARDGHKCVFCGSSEKLDAHHILERRLFTEIHEKGGYFLSNGSTVCEEHHLACEMTTISVEQVRDACGITKPRIPEFLYSDEVYTKWGDVILSNRMRTKGPMFNDPSVQKILSLGGVLGLYTDYVKYGRTLHLPWSQAMNDDDRMLRDMSDWIGKEIVVTEKIDGENTSIYSNYLHARAVDGRSHPSRNLLKAWAAQWQHELDEGWRVCGENAYARHSISYAALPHHFMGFSIWSNQNVCLSWDDTLLYFDLLGITPVPILYRGVYDEKIVRGLWDESKWATTEGYVMRTANSFTYSEFHKCMAKFVRKGQVQHTKHHWASQPVIPNGILTP